MRYGADLTMIFEKLNPSCQTDKNNFNKYRGVLSHIVATERLITCFKKRTLASA
jgi:hypothetical protein